MLSRTGYASPHPVHTSSLAASSARRPARHLGQTMMSSTQASSSIFTSFCSTSDASFGTGAGAAYQAEHLVPDRGHLYLVRGLDVEPQQRLGVGRAEVE